jgi:hypothetical protein
MAATHHPMTGSQATGLQHRLADVKEKRRQGATATATTRLKAVLRTKINGNNHDSPDAL